MSSSGLASRIRKSAIDPFAIVPVLAIRRNSAPFFVAATITCAGVGMMAFEYKAVRAKGGALKLLSLTGHNHRVLAMMKLMTVFEVFQDEALAIRSFERTRPT